MKRVLLVVLLLLPGFVRASSDCRVVDYPDHFEAVCVGDAPSAADASQPGAASGAAPAGRPTPPILWQPRAKEEAAPQQSALGQDPLSYSATYLAGGAVATWGGTAAAPSSSQPTTQVAVTTYTPQAPTTTAQQVDPPSYPTSGLVNTRRGPFWVQANNSGGYTATPVSLTGGAL